MSKLIQQLIFTLLIVGGIVIYVQKDQKPDISWTPTYSSQDKMPYGTYILRKELSGLLKGAKVESIEENLYEFLITANKDSLTQVNLLTITNEISWDQALVKQLFYFVENGNTAVLLQTHFQESLLDSLGIEKNYVIPNLSYSDQGKLQLTNKNLHHQGFHYQHLEPYILQIKDSAKANITILGTKTMGDKKHPNLVKVPLKKGNLILGTDPIALTNNNLLISNNHLYAQSLLSYLPQQTTYYLDDTPVGDIKQVISGSQMRFIFDNPGLKWAWNTLVFTLVVFIVFSTSRDQRILPIIKPLENNSVSFLKAISFMFLQNKEYGDLIDKSIFFTLEKIRHKYAISTQVLDKDFVTKLHTKSNLDTKDIQALVDFIVQYKNSNIVATKENLIKFNTLRQKIIH